MLELLMLFSVMAVVFYLARPNHEIKKLLKQDYHQPPADAKKKIIVFIGGLPSMEWIAEALSETVSNFRFIFVNPMHCMNLNKDKTAPIIDRINKGVVKFLESQEIEEIEYLIPYSGGIGFIRDLLSYEGIEIRHIRPYNSVGLCQFSQTAYLWRIVKMICRNLTNHNTRFLTKVVVWEVVRVFVKHYKYYMAITNEITFGDNKDIWKMAGKLNLKFYVSESDELFPLEDVILGIKALDKSYEKLSEVGHFSILQSTLTATILSRLIK